MYLIYVLSLGSANSLNTPMDTPVSCYAELCMPNAIYKLFDSCHVKKLAVILRFACK